MNLTSDQKTKLEWAIVVLIIIIAIVFIIIGLQKATKVYNEGFKEIKIEKECAKKLCVKKSTTQHS